jgi:hypothetical protein
MMKDLAMLKKKAAAKAAAQEHVESSHEKERTGASSPGQSTCLEQRDRRPVRDSADRKQHASPFGQAGRLRK